MPIKVCIAGATGWAGSELARGVAASGDLVLASGVSRRHAGEAIGDVLGDPRIGGTPDATPTLTPSARNITGRLLPTSAGHGSAPAYDLPHRQQDLQGNPVPRGGRNFGPVAGGS